MHENPWFSVSRQQTGTQEWYRIEAADSAIVLGKTREEKILFIQGVRGASGSPQAYELPGGIVEPQETPREAAARETEEETGYRASSLVSVGSFFPVPAISDARCHVFEAHVEPIGEARLEEGEQWRSVLVEVAELRSLMTSGAILDSATLAALGLYLAAAKSMSSGGRG
ncbi:MAG: NUDIX hydrolase [Rhodoglobus sp.]